MKLALQIYSLRNTLMHDMEGHFKAIKEMGYDGVELVDFGGNSVDRMADIMKAEGLELFSVHTDFNRMAEADEALLAHYRDLGCRVMPIGWLPEDRIAGGEHFEETLEVIRRYSASASSYGIRLVYHNHDFDLAPLGNTRKLDALYAALPPEILGAELDTCWIYSGGGDVMDYLDRFGPRTPVLHIKDCCKEGGRKGFRVPGEGVLDFAPIVKKAYELTIPWLCVEQDEPSPDKTAMQCAAEGAAFMRTLIK